MCVCLQLDMQMCAHVHVNNKKLSSVLLVHHVKHTALRYTLITLQYLIFPPSDGHKQSATGDVHD